MRKLRVITLFLAAASITTVAQAEESGSSIGDGGPALQARLFHPSGISLMTNGSLLIADSGHNRIRKVATDGTITTVAGTGQRGQKGDDGPATSAKLSNPLDVSAGENQSFLIDDYRSHRLRRVNKNGIIDTVVGTGTATLGGQGSTPKTTRVGSIESATYFKGEFPFWGEYCCVDPDDRTLSRGLIRRIGSSDQVITIAGTKSGGSCKNNIPAKSARLYAIEAIAVRNDGAVVFSQPAIGQVRMVTPSGVVKTLAGRKTKKCPGMGKKAKKFLWVAGVAFTPAGEVIFADRGKNRLYRIKRSGKVVVVAGTGTAGFSGDGGPAGKAKLRSPENVIVTQKGAIIFSDLGNNTIRKIGTDGKIRSIAGRPHVASGEYFE